MAESESQKRANAKWIKKNKAKHRMYVKKSTAKNYIRHTKNKKGLLLLLNMIKKRLREL